MNRKLITLYFDCESNKEDHERDIYRFILNYEDDTFEKKMGEVFEKNKFAWGECKTGYKTIFSSYQVDITGLDEY